MRLIDADAMEKRRIDYIVDGYAESVNDMTEWGMALIEAPTIGGWIPVTERLPEEHAMVLACWHDIRRGHEDAYSIIPSWVEHEKWRSSAGFIYRKVIAWMPLPEPYKEDE